MKVVKRPVDDPPVVYDILGLTREEAEALLDVLGNVGGNRKTTRRRLTERIYESLIRCGGLTPSYKKGFNDLDGIMSFREKEDW